MEKIGKVVSICRVDRGSEKWGFRKDRRRGRKEEEEDLLLDGIPIENP